MTLPIESSVDIDLDQAYNLLNESYLKATGYAWTKEKFLQRASSWQFYGDSDGCLAVRPQRGGMLKMVACFGSPRSIVKGVLEVNKLNVPVWGMMDRALVDKLKKIGYIEPPAFLIRSIIPIIPPSVFGDADYKINNDGSVTFNYSDVGSATKFFIANRKYYETMLELIKTRHDVPDTVKAVILPAIKTLLSGVALMQKIFANATASASTEPAVIPELVNPDSVELPQVPATPETKPVTAATSKPSLPLLLKELKKIHENNEFLIGMAKKHQHNPDAKHAGDLSKAENNLIDCIVEYLETGNLSSLHSYSNLLD